MAYPDDERDIEVGFAFGENPSSDPTGLTYTTVAPNPDDEGDPGDVLGPVTIARGRIGDAATTQPTVIETALRNDSGKYSRRNMSGPYAGQLRQGTWGQVRVDVGAGMTVRGRAIQQEWTPTWRGPGIDDQVPIKALGLLSRLGEDKTVYSRLYLATRASSSSVVAYWPMEDGTESGVFASGLPGGQPASVSSANFAANSTLPGSKPLPTFDATSEVVSSLTDASVTDAWLWTIFARYPVAPGSSVDLLRIEVANGTVGVIEVTADASTVTLRVLDEDGSLIDEDSSVFVHTALFSDEWVVWSISADSSASTVTCAVRPIGESPPGVSASVTDGSIAVGRPTAIIKSASAALDGASLGHESVQPFDGSALPWSLNEELGGVGESAIGRLVRLASVYGFPDGFLVSSGSPLMGVAKPATILQWLRECEAADHGILYDRLDGLLGYLSRTDLYNLPVSMALDYGTEAESGNCNIYMTDDDRDLYNVVTVSRVDGSSATAEQETGPVGTDEIGARPLSLALNLAEDTQVPDHAGWVLHETTTDQPRYLVTIDLYANPDLRSTWLGCDIGSRITVANAPAEHVGPDDLDLILVGYVETFDTPSWTAVLYCEPYAPYVVPEYAEADATAEDDPPRYDTAQCETLNGLWLPPGTSGAYASTPDNVALEITGDIDVRVDAILTNWASGSSQALMARWNSGSSVFVWIFGINADGTLAFYWSTDGTGGAIVGADSAEPPPIPASGRLAVRATLDANPGDVTFGYTSDVDLSTTDWEQLGSSISVGVTSIVGTTNLPLEVGSTDNGTVDRATGVIMGAQVRSGIDGTIRANPFFEGEPTGTTNFTDSAGRPWSVNGAAKIYHDFVAGTDTELLVWTRLGQPWTTKAEALPMRLQCGGSVLEVTGVNAVAVPQILTVSTTVVNGVEQSIAPGEPISLARPAKYAL